MINNYQQPIEEYTQTLSNQDLINFHIEKITGHADLTSQFNLFTDLTGHASLTLMLSRLIYWSDRSSRTDGFVYKSATDWKTETRVSRYYVRRFKDLPFVITELHRANKRPTTHYKVDFDLLIEALYDLQSKIKPGDNKKPQSLPAAKKPTDQKQTNHTSDCDDHLHAQEIPASLSKHIFRNPMLRNRGKITPINDSYTADNRAKLPPIELSSPPDGGKITPIVDFLRPDMGAKMPLNDPSQTPDQGKITPVLGQNRPSKGAKLPQHGGKIDKSLTLNTTINTSINTNNKLKDLKDLKDFSADADFPSNSQENENEIDFSTKPKTDILEINPDCQKPNSDPIDPPPQPADDPPDNQPSKSTNKFPNYQEFLKELAEITHFDLAIKANAARLGRAASQLLTAGYSVDDLRNFFNHWIENDWRWKNNGQFPKPETVLSDIAQVKTIQDKAYYDRQKYNRWLK